MLCLSLQSHLWTLRARTSPMLPWMAVLLFVPCVGKTVWPHLQVSPNPVFEGDTLILRCQGKNIALPHVRFYKDGAILNLTKDKQPLLIRPATVTSSGQYSCSIQTRHALNILTQTSRNVAVQVQELFPPPVLSVVPSHEPREGSLVALRCQTKLHPQRLAQQLFFSFHKDGYTLQDRSRHPELHIPEVREGNSGLYWCVVAIEGGKIQKQSPRLQLRVQAPVSRPQLTLQHRPTHLAYGSTMALLCETERGSPPILYSFYLNGAILGSRVHSAPQGGAASFLFPVKSEQDAGNYSCEAENSVSRERSEPQMLSLDGPRVLSTPAGSNHLVPWLPASLLGVMGLAVGLLGYFRPWEKAEPLPSQNPPPAPDGQQCPLYASVHQQEERDDDVTYSVVHVVSKRSGASYEKEN
ncbi:Fc receptor-like protein 6 [Tupaia chinensis]|uniref:Fc receptor-like protein 6 n=1 Tax=Tupaia chinensis TaxID=246437 RepID=UPI000FFC60B3|nr:Fc receptor-like protein 6 [Tupaia chinensis]